MKIVVFEIEPREREAFGTLAAGHDVLFADEPLTARNAAEFGDADIVSTFIYSALGPETLEPMPSLGLIATRSTGIDHIDTAYCASRGILVCNVPSYGANTVAEHVFALLLAISHRLPEAVERARTGPFSPQGLQGFDLAGKILGVIGTGAIGRHVIQIAKGFGMSVIASDIEPDAGLAKSLGFEYARFGEVLAESDVITLHVPATAENRHLLSADQFARMKNGTVLINTARGDLIDARALIEALGAGKIAAAGLDVLPDEPLIREEAELICSIYCEKHDLRDLVASHVLMRMPNVLVTPHSAFNTREAVHRIVETTVANISAFIEQRPVNQVA